jgi:hypothetical protein
LRLFADHELAAFLFEKFVQLALMRMIARANDCERSRDGRLQIARG